MTHQSLKVVNRSFKQKLQKVASSAAHGAAVAGAVIVTAPAYAAAGDLGLDTAPVVANITEGSDFSKVILVAYIVWFAIMSVLKKSRGAVR